MYQKPNKIKAKCIPQPKSYRNIKPTEENKENMPSKLNQRGSFTRQFGKDITNTLKNTSLDKNRNTNNSLGKKSVGKENAKVK